VGFEFVGCPFSDETLSLLSDVDPQVGVIDVLWLEFGIAVPKNACVQLLLFLPFRETVKLTHISLKSTRPGPLAGKYCELMLVSLI
jgi:hypothetical protein